MIKPSPFCAYGAFLLGWSQALRYDVVQVRKPSAKPLAVFKMGDHSETLVTSLVTRLGLVPTLAIVKRI